MTHALKEKLEAEKKTLMDELSGLGTRDKESGDWEATSPIEAGEPTESDENDLASRSEGFEERSSTLGVLEARLRDVTEALARMEAGNYGACDVCGSPIESDRLEANPAARTCMTHMSA